MFDTRTLLIVLGSAAAGAAGLHFYKKAKAPAVARRGVDPARVKKLMEEKAKLEQSTAPSDQARLAEVIKELAGELVQTSAGGLIKTFQPS